MHQRRSKTDAADAPKIGRQQNCKGSLRPDCRAKRGQVARANIRFAHCEVDFGYDDDAQLADYGSSQSDGEACYYYESELEMTSVFPFPPRAALDPRANRDEVVRCIVARLLSEVDAQEDKKIRAYAVGTVSAQDISLKTSPHLSGLCFWIWSARTEVLKGFIRAGGHRLD